MKHTVALILFVIAVGVPPLTWADAVALEADSLKIARASLQTEEAKEIAGSDGRVIRLDPGELEGAELEPLRIYVDEHAHIWGEGKWAKISWDKLQEVAQSYRDASHAISAEPYVTIEVDAATESKGFQTAIARIAAPFNGKALRRIFLRPHKQNQMPAKPARLPLPPPRPNKE